MSFVFYLIGIGLTLVTLPGTIELALLTLGALPLGGRVKKRGTSLAERRTNETEDKKIPIRRLAIVVPAHNEVASIADCVRSLSRCERPPTLDAANIVVIADNCTDQTAELASRAGARVIERRDSQRRGKGFALQAAFAKLLGEGFDAILVVDADTVVDPNLLTEVVRLFDQGANGVQARYLPLGVTDSPRARLRNVALTAFNFLRPLARDRLGMSCGITGNGFALRRDTLEAVPYRADSIVEDLEYHVSIVRAGLRIRFAGATTVRAPVPVSGVAARTQRARWEGGRARMIAKYAPALASEVIHNARLLEPLLELLLLPLALHVSLLVVGLAIPFFPGQIYSAFALALVGLHVGLAIKLGGGGWTDLSGLTAVPAYIAWKVSLMSATLRSTRSNSEWRRTERQ
ncbi:MAG: glycosyltransferase [Deltaproteobacteria bacterium]|nr:glycosyltransferase [Deltaproteobacteria bacterium]